eukprot:1430824-Prymnesium_polylepis.1
MKPSCDRGRAPRGREADVSEARRRAMRTSPDAHQRDALRASRRNHTARGESRDCTCACIAPPRRTTFRATPRRLVTYRVPPLVA